MSKQAVENVKNSIKVEAIVKKNEIHKEKFIPDRMDISVRTVKTRFFVSLNLVIAAFGILFSGKANINFID